MAFREDIEKDYPTNLNLFIIRNVKEQQNFFIATSDSLKEVQKRMSKNTKVEHKIWLYSKALN